MNGLDVRAHNRAAWDRQVEQQNPWTRPVTSAQVSAARHGDWTIVLTWERTVPADWFPPLPGCEVLCLASGGGQQGPLLAAAGARVTILDLSPAQLAQDRLVAERDTLSLVLVEGDMRDLSMFASERFDLIVHPTATMYVPDVRPMWREAFRVLRRGGSMLSGFINPIAYAFDGELAGQDIYQLRYPLPYSDLASLTPGELDRILAEGDTLQFSHTFVDQIGGQLEAGFLLAGFYEDRKPGWLLSTYMPTHFATRALKP